MGNIEARLARLEAAENARAPIIVYEAGDEVTEEEAVGFSARPSGHSPPANWSSDSGGLVRGPCPPRLISIGGRPPVTAPSENQNNPEPLGHADAFRNGRQHQGLPECL